MRVDIVTIFPDYLAPLDLSLIGRARTLGLLDLAVHDLRRWTSDVHRTVDDTPYGGGPGMVMRPEPWGAALDLLAPSGAPDGVSAPSGVPHGEVGHGGAEHGGVGHGGAEQGGAEHGGAEHGGAEHGRAEHGGAEQGPAGVRLVVPTPTGTPFTQAMAHELARVDHLIFACGRYEGIDQRVVEHAAARMPVTEVSLGDYVLFGGEVAVLVILEAVTRLLPGVLGNAESLAEESHTAGLLEAPVYTKPARWRGLDVPEVLRSGDHGGIARWRRDEALRRTARRRPDLLAGLSPERLDRRDVATLAEAGFPVRAPDMAK